MDLDQEFMKGAREAVLPRWQLPAHAAEVMVIFGFPHGADCPDFLVWRSFMDGRILLYADCSDTFAWGTADSELIEEKDMPLLRRCYDDLSAIRESMIDLSSLFAARKRRVVPMPQFMRHVDERVKRFFMSVTEEH